MTCRKALNEGTGSQTWWPVFLFAELYHWPELKVLDYIPKSTNDFWNLAHISLFLTQTFAITYINITQKRKQLAWGTEGKFINIQVYWLCLPELIKMRNMHIISQSSSIGQVVSSFHGYLCLLRLPYTWVTKGRACHNSYLHITEYKCWGNLLYGNLLAWWCKNEMVRVSQMHLNTTLDFSNLGRCRLLKITLKKGIVPLFSWSFGC